MGASIIPLGKLSGSIPKKKWLNDMVRDEELNAKTRGIKAYAQYTSQVAHQQVDQAIEYLVRHQKLINFNTVPNGAKVTKNYLYAYCLKAK